MRNGRLIFSLHRTSNCFRPSMSSLFLSLSLSLSVALSTAGVLPLASCFSTHSPAGKLFFSLCSLAPLFASSLSSLSLSLSLSLCFFLFLASCCCFLSLAPHSLILFLLCLSFSFSFSYSFFAVARAKDRADARASAGRKHLRIVAVCEIATLSDGNEHLAKPSSCVLLIEEKLFPFKDRTCIVYKKRPIR